MIQENPIVIKNREELIFVLSEAAMLEHMIMCEYLFAAFSLKRDVSEGVTPPQFEALFNWHCFHLDRMPYSIFCILSAPKAWISKMHRNFSFLLM